MGENPMFIMDDTSEEDFAHVEASGGSAEKKWMYPEIVEEAYKYSHFNTKFSLDKDNSSYIGLKCFNFLKSNPKVEGTMGYCLQKFDTLLTRTFYKLGKYIANNTGYFIIVPLLITALLSTGFQRIRYEDDPEYLFSPTNGVAKQERRTVEDYFKQNVSDDFNPARSTNVRFSRFIVIAKDEGNLLREDVWEDIMKLDKMLHEEVVVEHEGETYRYDDLCTVWEGKCLENDILDIGELIPEVINKTYNISYPFMINPNTFSMYIFPFYFGGITLNEEQAIESVNALNLFYAIKNSNRDATLKANKFEYQVKEVFQKAKFDKIKISFFTTKTMETELEANTNSVIPYFGATITIMLLFCMVSLTMGDCVRSKALLGMAGVICSFLSCAAAFGFLTYVGVPFIGINLAAPFLMLGIGIDDTFVMLAAWRRTRIQDSVAERLAHSYADAAVSITITSLTDMVSFFIGAITPFPSVQIFCVYTGTAVLMTYLWHVTLFGACLAYAGRAEKKQIHNMTCRPVKALSQSHDDSCFYRSCCSGGIDANDPWNPEDNRRHSIMVFFRDYVATFLNIPAVKAMVVVVFFAYISVAIWGCTKVEEGLERRKLSRYDSYSVEFYDMDDKYFRAFPYRIQLLFIGEMDYSDKVVQDKVLDYLKKIEDHAHIAESLYTESWLKSFISFMDRNGEYLGLNNTDEQTFIDNLIEHQLSGKGNPYASDVVFNENKTKIIASRFMIQAFNVSGATEDKELMIELRELAKTSGDLNVTFYNPFFIFFDQFLMVRSISIQAISLAAIVMMVVSLIFIPNPLCSLWVAFSIISIEIGVVGYMSLWGVNLDSISMIQLIMCIGFSVDFSAHISYAYLAAKVDTPDERVKECLYALGLPIVQGGLSTILGIMALILAPSYIFITFFKTVFLVIFFGAVHGLFLLPVLLSLLGPGSFSKKKKNAESNITAPAPVYCKHHQMYNHEAISTNGVPHIPRPKTIGTPSYKTKVITTEPFAYKNGKNFNRATANGNIAHVDSESIERDLGLGTSGEESSESSLRQGVTRKSNSASATGSSGSDDSKQRSPSLKGVANTGYVSDNYDVEKARSKDRQNVFYGEWENLQTVEDPRNMRWHSARYSSTEPTNVVGKLYRQRPNKSPDNKDHRKSSRDRH